jgi:predicted dehydrogenase
MHLVYHQRMQLLGTRGRIEMVMPFTPPPDRASYILIDNARNGIFTETFPPCNQFTIQGEAFSRAVREGTSVPVPLTDAIKNMAVIEAMVRSGQAGGKRPSTSRAGRPRRFFAEYISPISTLIPPIRIKLHEA